MSKTKWDYLVDKRNTVREMLKGIEDEMEAMEKKPFDGTCTGCGLLLVTEADFARHFIVTDPRYQNLGECPDKKAPTVHEV